MQSNVVVKLLLVVVAMVHLQRVAYAECVFRGGNFTNSCTDVRLVGDGLHLNANCGDPPNTSQLYLNEKIVNDNGVLRCKECWGALGILRANCEFSHSCSNVRLSGSLLSASCLNFDHHPVASSLNLDDCVLDNHGQLDWVC